MRHRGSGAGGAQLLARPGRPRLLGFGEPLHGEEEFSRLRNALFGYLVRHAGFRSIALESSCWAGRAVDAYVRHQPGDEDDVMAHGFSHDFGASPANRDLVRWMRQHNADRAASSAQKAGSATYG